MTYEQSLSLLYGRRAGYEREGSAGYKPGLANIEALCSALGHPERRLRCIHVAGTNGKGSVCSLIAAALQAQGWCTGLFTSPHLVDFRERIRINGRMIDREFVVRFVERVVALDLGCEPTFFEMTTALAFEWFAHCGVDIAVIEAGLGGRLDSTNIITPLLTVVTNVSLDHTDLLGNTLEQIASEKAGIFKHGVPALLGQAGTESVRGVFEHAASLLGCPLTVVDDCPEVCAEPLVHAEGLLMPTRSFGLLRCDLGGRYQRYNVSTALAAIGVLRGQGIAVSDTSVRRGFGNVGRLTGLTGRWTILATEPLTLCDSAHNPGAWIEVVGQLAGLHCRCLHFVLAFMADKDVRTIVSMLPRDGARYYFTQAATPRSLEASALQGLAAQCGLTGEAYADAQQAYRAAQQAADVRRDAIYIGGSMYLLGTFLPHNS